MSMHRLPALPLVVYDPYFSIWLAGDTLTDAVPTHWSGRAKPLLGLITIDGQAYRFLGQSDAPAMRTVEQTVTPMATTAVLQAAGVRLTVRFVTPALPDDLDCFSTPITMVEIEIVSDDGQPHETALSLFASSALCYDCEERPSMLHNQYTRDSLQIAFCGRQYQNLLGHSGDHFTIDWDYLYLATEGALRTDEEGLAASWTDNVTSSAPLRARALLGYDDVASILYFGTPCKAWYARHAATLPDQLVMMHERFDALLSSCAALDDRLLTAARALGGETYASLISAAYRQCTGAHKLIATPKGEMALLSKENDSNGCIGTVDITYPSSSLFLLLCPELVNAMCRPVLAFAEMPVWRDAFAPHDVGRYPIVSGQMYGVRIPDGQRGKGFVPPPFYLYPAEMDIYDPKYQMPIEECGNLLILLTATAIRTGDLTLAKKHKRLLDKWAAYLVQHGENPAEQLCTDDFAGHSVGNVNLAAKAMVAIACYARLLKMLGEPYSHMEDTARRMAERWLLNARAGDATTLTFDGAGWSLKYNLVWDLVLGLMLMPKEVYAAEIDLYIQKQNRYGTPLDSRQTYSKTDWIVWAATMAETPDIFTEMIAPLARYLHETESRVPFSDLYDTVTGKSPAFIARSVQGAVFIPLLKPGFAGIAGLKSPQPDAYTPGAKSRLSG